MEELIIATNNQHKIEELRACFPSAFKLITLKELDFNQDIPETGNTLSDNALQKARFVFEKFGRNCFADDTGLEIEVLEGRPGVYSARYAGENCSPKDNRAKVLAEMRGADNRKACFKTVIALILEGEEFLFEGQINGEILTTEYGDGGFGYDSIFLPEEQFLTFAEMPLEIKNQFSHRARAISNLLHFLRVNPPKLPVVNP